MIPPRVATEIICHVVTHEQYHRGQILPGWRYWDAGTFPIMTCCVSAD